MVEEGWERAGRGLGKDELEQDGPEKGWKRVGKGLEKDGLERGILRLCNSLKLRASITKAQRSLAWIYAKLPSVGRDLFAEARCRLRT